MNFKKANLSVLLLVCFALVGCQSRPQARSVITVTASYPGADAEMIAQTVAVPIEFVVMVPGTDGMQSMTSGCGDDGSYTLTLTFASPEERDAAMPNVQRRVNVILAQLPPGVRVVTRKEAVTGPIMLVKLSSPDKSQDRLALSNHAVLQLKELTRIAGVAEVNIVGHAEQVTRVLLDPDRLRAYAISTADVYKAFRDEEARSKKKPKLPRDGGRLLELQLPADQGDLGKMVIRTLKNGEVLRLRDLARIEVGPGGRDQQAAANGQPAVLLAIHALSASPSQDLFRDLRQRIRQLEAKLPKGMALEELKGSADRFLLDVDLPSGTARERQLKALERCWNSLKNVDGVNEVITITENPFDRRSNRPCVLVSLVAKERTKAERDRLAQAIRARFADAKDFKVRLRNASEAYPLDLAIHGPDLDRVTKLAVALEGRLRRSDKLTDVWLDPASLPIARLKVVIERDAAAKKGCAMSEIMDTFSDTYGLKDFSMFSRSVEIRPQADIRRDLDKLFVRNRKGEMVPLSQLVTLKQWQAPAVICRFDASPMVQITANPAAGTSLAEVRTICEHLADEVRRELKLPQEYRLGLR